MARELAAGMAESCAAGDLAAVEVALDAIGRLAGVTGGVPASASALIRSPTRV